LKCADDISTARYPTSIDFQCVLEIRRRSAHLQDIDGIPNVGAIG